MCHEQCASDRNRAKLGSSSIVVMAEHNSARCTTSPPINLSDLAVFTGDGDVMLKFAVIP